MIRWLLRQNKDFLNHSEASRSLAGKEEQWLVVVDH
jgi:hypothetical protein